MDAERRDHLAAASRLGFMTTRTAVRWADLHAWSFGDRRRAALWQWVVVPLGCMTAVLAPWPFTALVAFAALFAVVWRHPGAIGLLFIALMGNVKINYYAGFITVFPEYLVLVLAVATWVLRSWERPQTLEEPEILTAFGAWILAGMASFVFAYSIPKVLAKCVLLGFAAIIFVFVVRSFRDSREIRRAILWLMASSGVVALYGVVQMIGVFANVDTSLGFLRRWGNPEFEYSIGAPVLYQLTSTFRANSFFNDPNIFAGYLAAILPTLTLRLLMPQAARTRSERVVALLSFLLVSFALVLSLSRSGILGAVVGMGVALVCVPRALATVRIWLGLAGAVALAVVASAAIGVNAFIIIGRLSGAFEGGEYSARVHKDIFNYGLELFARHPFTGVGMGNFGQYYGREVDPTTPTMMAHNMWLANFAEAGLFGGVAFLVLWWLILRRPIDVLRSGAARGIPEDSRACVAGLVGGLVALFISNIFYDYSLRTFIWVMAGLTVAASRVASREAAH
jgi:O-antigen ligase